MLPYEPGLPFARDGPAVTAQRGKDRCWRPASRPRWSTAAERRHSPTHQPFCKAAVTHFDSPTPSAGFRGSLRPISSRPARPLRSSALLRPYSLSYFACSTASPVLICFFREVYDSFTVPPRFFFRSPNPIIRTLNSDFFSVTVFRIPAPCAEFYNGGET
jgi:hypothetical protein